MKMNYTITLPAYNEKTTELNFKGENKKKQETLGITDRYFVKNGRPWFPVMGEFHFSRYSNELWEEELVKMKMGGVDIVASYIIWIHHEEIEGELDFTGDKNLRQFVQLCQKHDLQVLLRIGPWVHGECRNGGFPDWLLKKDFELRADNEPYLKLVRRLYEEIFQQVRGMLYKDGGCIIGVQIENEYGHCGGFRGEKGIQHMRTLKRLAKEVGFDLPFYTATGWGGAVVVEDEMLPVLGAYADAPWDASLEELPANDNYLFSHYYNDEQIGSDLSEGFSQEFTYNPAHYPYITAELGGGIQVTHRRRPIITAKDTEAMVYTKLGSGANLLGYYMYHGGTNFIGKCSTMQESIATGSANDLPILSYDFQGVIGEYGECHESYGYLRLLHLFLHEFGGDIASAVSYIPDENSTSAEDTKKLRFCVRFNDRAGFLFINNYQRHRKMIEKEDVSITITGRSDPVVFEHLRIREGQCFIYPFQWNVLGLKIRKATAQPLCIINDGKIPTLFFWSYERPAQFEIETIGTMTLGHPFSAYEFKTIQDGKVRLALLDRKIAERAMKVIIGGREALIVADGQLLQDKEKVCLNTDKGQASVLVFPQDLILDSVWEREETCQDGFARYILQTGNVVSEVPFSLLEERDSGDKIYRIDLQESIRSAKDDLFLEIDYSGDIANLYLNGRLSADWFYTGLTWRIGLKKFRDSLIGAEVTLQIKPLYQDTPVYIEIPPRYENGCACKLHSVRLFEKRSFPLL